YSYFPYENDLRDWFEPVVVPDSLNELYSYVGTLQTDKVLYLPYVPYVPGEGSSYSWNTFTSHPDEFYELSSPKPNVGFYPVLTQNYYRFLTSSIVQNSTGSINNLITPFGTSYIIFHNDTDNPANLDLLKSLSSSTDLKNIKNVGFFSIFKTDNNLSSINIPNLNIAALGGLDTLTSLNHLDSFNSNDTSLIFLDQDTKNEIDTNTTNTNVTNAIDGLILTGNANDLILSAIDDKYIIAPFDVTNHHNVSKLWSKSGILDPWHGEFHPYLQELGMENWDFDYGKGLVITQAKGATLDIPFNVERSDSYDIFLRYMNNQRGGELKVYLDNELVGNINTLDERSDSFVWENIISNTSLTTGRHILTLENVDGFNAVNVFATLPVDETARLKENAYLIANNTRNIYLFEPESDF
ncbi:MAG: hypothetical protein ACRD8Z_18750, partial [Nitrososphaeraceae archaeon]